MDRIEALTEANYRVITLKEAPGRRLALALSVSGTTLPQLPVVTRPFLVLCADNDCHYILAADNAAITANNGS